MKRAAALTIFFIFISHAQWSTDPNNNLIVAEGDFRAGNVCSDSTGGVFVVYNNSPILIRRVNRYGYQPWGGNRQVRGAFPEARAPLVTSDERGGVIIGFLDWYEPIPNIPSIRVRVQRIDSAGNLLWGQAGVRVSTNDTTQGIAGITGDGTGGCVVFFAEVPGRAGVDSALIRIQRIGSSGNRLWGDSGLVVERREPDVDEPPFFLLKTDPGAFVMGYMAPGHQATQLIKFDSNGTRLWGTMPANVGFLSTAATSRFDGNIIVAGMRTVNPNARFIISQKLDSSGNFVWPSPFVIASDTANLLISNGVILSSNQDGGTTVAWTKQINSTRHRSFAQRIRPNGSLGFGHGGLDISGNDSSSNSIAAVLESSQDTKIYLFADNRSTVSIWSQRLDSTGSRLWPDSDAVVSYLHLGELSATIDTRGGFVVVGYNSDFSIRAQQVSVNGGLGEMITSVHPEEPSAPPSTIRLHQNWPNPFNNSTEISFAMNSSGQIDLSVYNLLGQRVRTLVNGFQIAGEHRLQFDASNLATGTYLLRLVISSQIQSTKILLLK
jgi:hypothetical protein